MTLEAIKKIRAIRYVSQVSILNKTYHLLLALFGAMWFRFPSRDVAVVGITGTKGKSTTLELLSAMLEAGGKKTALLSSIRVKIGDDSEKNLTGNSMPGRFAIQRFLRRAVAAGCDAALIEVTSQGTSSFRHRWIDWRDALITNIAPEHIEAHGSFENYRAAKLLFLKYAAKKGAGIFLNSDDGASAYFKEALVRGGEIAEYSVSHLVKIPHETESVLPGKFNKENIAAAVAIAKKYGVGDNAIYEGLARFRGIPGRVEFVAREPFSVIVDYAHTPDSLQAIYRTVRPAGHKLVCVLGSCGGGRDKWKRPVLGEIAAENCDHVILTNEDPYDENPEDVVSAIAEGMRKKKAASFEVLIDRAEALKKAISLAQAGDVVLATGKGSEPYMHFARGKKIPWSDQEILKKALHEKN
ncbi:MAG: Mur ligase family protein [Patescibacteria group bacterium]